MNYRNKLSYSRINAVNYARTYAGSPNTAYRYFPVQGDNGGDCTNFISQCLRAGGSPMVFSGKTRWWYTGQSWSVSWAVASSLYWYLKINSAEKLYGVKGMQVNSTSKLELGDLIFYKNRKGRIQHSAIITSFNGNYPLISQHTPDLLDIPYEKSWADRIYFIKIYL